MELKPLMPTEVHVATFNDVMHSVSESIQAVTSISDVLHTNTLVHDHGLLESVDDVFKTESITAKMKIEFGDPEPLQSTYITNNRGAQ